MDSEVKSYIQAVREGGGVITTSITMAVATAFIRKAVQNLLAENRGPITITKDWDKCLLFCMDFVERRGSSTAKMTVENFDGVKEQFVNDVTAIIEKEDIPQQLAFNWYQTDSIVPGSS